MTNRGSIGWIIVLKRRWKLLLCSFLIPFLLTFLISLFVPKKYESTAKLLSPEMSSGGSVIQTPFGAIARGGSGMNISSQAIITILNSNFIVDKIVFKFNIKKLFGFENEILSRDYVKSNMVSIINDENNGLIKINVRSKYNNLNPKIANYYISLIDSANYYLKLTTNQEFIKVLDFAEPATIPYSPRKKLNALIGGILGIILCIIYIYLKDNLSFTDE